MILRFAEENNIVVLADEVYQENIYSPGKKFTSFRYVQQKIRSNVKLVKLHIFFRLQQVSNFFHIIVFSNQEPFSETTKKHVSYLQQTDRIIIFVGWQYFITYMISKQKVGHFFQSKK